MTTEEQRIAIAEACGIKVERNHSAPDSQGGVRYSPSAAIARKQRWPGAAHVTTIPDYCSDLNAMHDAEKVLPDEGWIKYQIALERTTGLSMQDRHLQITCIRATAAQRAEAFLRALGKWQEITPNPPALR